MFKKKVRIYFEQTDPAGIVFYGEFFSIAHRLTEDFLEARKIYWKDWFKHTKWVAPVRYCESEFLNPLYGGRTYTGKVSVERMSKHSITFCVCLFDGRIKMAQLKTTHVFVLRKTFKKCPIPMIFRKKLA